MNIRLKSKSLIELTPADSIVFLLHKRVNVVQESLNKCTSGVPRLFRRGNLDLEPEPENSTNLTEIMPIPPRRGSDN